MASVGATSLFSGNGASAISLKGDDDERDRSSIEQWIRSARDIWYATLYQMGEAQLRSVNSSKGIQAIGHILETLQIVGFGVIIMGQFVSRFKNSVWEYLARGVTWWQLNDGFGSEVFLSLFVFATAWYSLYFVLLAMLLISSRQQLKANLTGAKDTRRSGILAKLVMIMTRVNASVLVIPVQSIFWEFYNCDSNNQFALGKAVVTCFSDPSHVATTIVVTIFALVAVVINVMTQLALVDADLDSTSCIARLSGRANGVALVFKTLLAAQLAAIPALRSGWWMFIYIGTGCITWLYHNFVQFPHILPWQDDIETGKACAGLWTTCQLLIVLVDPAAQPGLLFALGLPVAASTGILVSRQRRARIVSTPLGDLTNVASISLWARTRFVASTEIQKRKSGLHSKVKHMEDINESENDPLLRSAGSMLGQNTQFGRASAADLQTLAERGFQLLLEKAPDSAIPRLQMASYYKATSLKSHYMELSMLAAAKALSSSFDINFRVFAQVRRLREHADGADRDSSGISATEQLSFDLHWTSALREEDVCRRNSLRLWTILQDQTTLDLKEFQVLAVRFHKARKRAEYHYKACLRTNPTSIVAAEAYAQFLANVVKDPVKASEQQVKAERLATIADRAANRSVQKFLLLDSYGSAGGRGGADGMGFGSGASVDENTGLVLISGDPDSIGGIISVNASVSRILGRTKTDLINQNICSFLPLPFQSISAAAILSALNSSSSSTQMDPMNAPSAAGDDRKSAAQSSHDGGSRSFGAAARQARSAMLSHAQSSGGLGRSGTNKDGESLWLNRPFLFVAQHASGSLLPLAITLQETAPAHGSCTPRFTLRMAPIKTTYDAIAITTDDDSTGFDVIAADSKMLAWLDVDDAWSLMERPVPLAALAPDLEVFMEIDNVEEDAQSSESETDEDDEAVGLLAEHGSVGSRGPKQHKDEAIGKHAALRQRAMSLRTALQRLSLEAAKRPTKWAASAPMRVKMRSKPAAEVLNAHALQSEGLDASMYAESNKYRLNDNDKQEDEMRHMDVIVQAICAPAGAAAAGIGGVGLSAGTTQPIVFAWYFVAAKKRKTQTTKKTSTQRLQRAVKMIASREKSKPTYQAYPAETFHTKGQSNRYNKEDLPTIGDHPQNSFQQDETSRLPGAVETSHASNGSGENLLSGNRTNISSTSTKSEEADQSYLPQLNGENSERQERNGTAEDIEPGFAFNGTTIHSPSDNEGSDLRYASLSPNPKPLRTFQSQRLTQDTEATDENDDNLVPRHTNNRTSKINFGATSSDLSIKGIIDVTEASNGAQTTMSEASPVKPRISSQSGRVVKYRLGQGTDINGTNGANANDDTASVGMMSLGSAHSRNFGNRSQTGKSSVKSSQRSVYIRTLKHTIDTAKASALRPVRNLRWTLVSLAMFMPIAAIITSVVWQYVFRQPMELHTLSMWDAGERLRIIQNAQQAIFGIQTISSGVSFQTFDTYLADLNDIKAQMKALNIRLLTDARTLRGEQLQFAFASNTVKIMEASTDRNVSMSLQEACEWFAAQLEVVRRYDAPSDFIDDPVSEGIMYNAQTLMPVINTSLEVKARDIDRFVLKQAIVTLVLVATIILFGFLLTLWLMYRNVRSLRDMRNAALVSFSHIPAYAVQSTRKRVLKETIQHARRVEEDQLGGQDASEDTDTRMQEVDESLDVETSNSKYSQGRRSRTRSAQYEQDDAESTMKDTINGGDAVAFEIPKEKNNSLVGIQGVQTRGRVVPTNDPIESTMHVGARHPPVARRLSDGGVKPSLKRAKAPARSRTRTGRSVVDTSMFVPKTLAKMMAPILGLLVWVLVSFLLDLEVFAVLGNVVQRSYMLQQIGAQVGDYRGSIYNAAFSRTTRIQDIADAMRREDEMRTQMTTLLHGGPAPLYTKEKTISKGILDGRLRGLSDTSDSFALLTINACPGSTIVDCETAFNGIMAEGYAAALQNFWLKGNAMMGIIESNETASFDQLAAQFPNKTIPTMQYMSDLAYAALRRSNIHLSTTLRDNGLSDISVISSIQNTILLSLGFGVCFVILISFLPLIQRVGRQIFASYSLLLLIPDDILSTVPNIRQEIRRASVSMNLSGSSADDLGDLENSLLESNGANNSSTGENPSKPGN